MELEHWCLWFKRRGAGRLRHVLMRHWDPISVVGAPQARDEYDSYVGPVADRLRNGSSSEALAEYLGSVRTVRMGLRADRRADLAAAQAVTDWYNGEIARASTLVQGDS